MCIAGYKFYCFIDSIYHCQEQQRRSSCLFRMIYVFARFDSLHILTYSHLYFITNIFYLHSLFYQFPNTIFTLKSHSSLLKIVILIDGSQFSLFKLIQSFLIVHVNTPMHEYTINYYCYLHHYFTVCEVQVISVSLIQLITVSNSEIREVVCLERMQFLYDLNHSIFWCTHIHTSSLTSIICIFYFITFLSKIYPEVTLFVVEKSVFIIEGSQVFTFKPIPSF